MGLFDLGGGGKLGGLLNSKINKVVSNAVSSVMSFVGNLFGGGKDKKSSIINYTYKYKVSSFKVCLPGQKPTKIINEAVNRIMITKLFDKNIHPIFEMLVNLPPKLYQEIIRNKNEVTFILRIQASAYNANPGREAIFSSNKPSPENMMKQIKLEVRLITIHLSTMENFY